VAFQEALEYARTRPQGRPLTKRRPESPQVPIVQHADVKRMLLRQKAIAEGGLLLLGYASRCADLAEHAESKEERQRAHLLLDLLTPVVKSFPAERGFEANVLAVQVHGGYGYSSEYLPEAWLRDQKLNSIHEGTSGIQSLDLLGRKVSLFEGAALKELALEITRCVEDARAAGVDARLCDELARCLGTTLELTQHLIGLRDPEARLLHSADYLELFSTLVVGFMWLMQASAAQRALASDPRDALFYRGKLLAAQYWIFNDLPRIDHLAALCRRGEDSYAKLDPDSL
jgi:butyryl-CoA dehydrogenase